MLAIAGHDMGDLTDPVQQLGRRVLMSALLGCSSMAPLKSRGHELLLEMRNLLVFGIESLVK